MLVQIEDVITAEEDASVVESKMYLLQIVFNMQTGETKSWVFRDS